MGYYQNYQAPDRRTSNLSRRFQQYRQQQEEDQSVASVDSKTTDSSLDGSIERDFMQAPRK